MVFCLVAAFVPPARAQGVLPDCEEPVRPGVIASALSSGEFTLASGEQIRLADIRLTGAEAGDIALAREAPPVLRAWLLSLASTPVLVAAGAADRWSTRRGRLVLQPHKASGRQEASGGQEESGRQEASGRPGLDLAELLVGEGFALVDAGEADALCRPTLLALEAKARRGRLGIWAGPDAPLVAAGDTAALAARLGRFTLVEGRVVSVGERPSRTYLNFGRFGTGAFTLTISKRSWAALRRRGVSAETLRGRQVRARGIVEMWRAPVMEIVAPELLEMMEAVAEPPR